MILYKTFADGNFQGYLPIKEVIALRNEAYRLALEKQKAKPADHMMYGHYDLTDEGKVETVWLYSGEAYTDAEFERIATMRNVHIYAIHSHK